MARILFILIFFGLCVTIPFFFYDLVTFCLTKVGTGWVFATFFVRFVVIIFFVLGLNLIFSFFRKTEKMKFIYVFIIGLLPGFGISFITPIYNTDYGDFSNDFEYTGLDTLNAYTNGGYDPEGQRHIAAFFSTDCGHCQNVAAKIGINQIAGQEIKVFAFFIEPPEKIIEFLSTTNGQGFDAFQINNPGLFTQIADFEFPSVFLVDRDGSTMRHWAGDVVNYSALDYLLEIEP